MNDKINAGKEHGVEWNVNFSNYDPVIISVKSEKGSENFVHHCFYRPIFGYDVSDIETINQKLEELIIKYATDGYTGEGK